MAPLTTAFETGMVLAVSLWGDLYAILPAAVGHDGHVGDCGRNGAVDHRVRDGDGVGGQLVGRHFD